MVKLFLFFFFCLSPVIRRGRLKKKQKKTLPKSSGQADKKWRPFYSLSFFVFIVLMHALHVLVVPWLSFGTTPAISGTGVVNNIGSLMLSWVGWLNTFDSPWSYLSAGRFCFFSSRKRKWRQQYIMPSEMVYEPYFPISSRARRTGLRKKCVKKIWGGM